MELIGEDGQPAPRLKDADVDNYDVTYLEVVKIMCTMFQKCKLVHSDLSEYNLLYLNKELYVIDVAQAVEDDHPNALSFLKRDCTNINNFFNKCGVEVITNRQLFNLITTLNNKKEFSIEEIQATVSKTREINIQLTKMNNLYFDQENVKFDNSDFFRTLSDVDEIKIGQNSEVRKALTQLCGIVDKDIPDEKIIENNDEENNGLVDNDDLLNKKITTELDQPYSTCNNNKNTNYIDEIINEETNEENHEEDEQDEEEESEDSLEIDEKEAEIKEEINEKLNLYFDSNGKIIDKETYLKNKLVKEDELKSSPNMKVKKPHNWDPFEGLTKAERKKKVKEENKLKRETKILSKYEKNKKIEKTTGKRK